MKMTSKQQIKERAEQERTQKLIERYRRMYSQRYGKGPNLGGKMKADAVERLIAKFDNNTSINTAIKTPWTPEYFHIIKEAVS